MRALAALLLLVGCSATVRNAHQNNHPQRSTFDGTIDKLMISALRRLDNRRDVRWPERIVKCSRTLGVSKCTKAFSAWSAENAVDLFSNRRNVQFDLTSELDQFPWEQFVNVSDLDLGARLSDGAVQLLRYRSLSLSVYPGLEFELDSKRNGTLSLDVCSSDEGESRSMGKKLRKQFYRVVPFLLVPGLIMAAILPFMLPALKMMTVGVGMLNQMALTGAIFTLLRNNAFDDKYHKKVIYVNDGYKNEKHVPIYGDDDPQDGYFSHDYESKYLDSDIGHNNYMQMAPADWIGQYYGDSSHLQDMKDYKKRRSNEVKVNNNLNYFTKRT